MPRALALVLAIPALAADFDRDIAPILAKRCVQCHGAAVKMAGLDLRSAAAILAGGAKGPAVVKGKSGASLLHQRIADGSMPMGGPKLGDGESRAIREWIDAGAQAGSASAAAQTGAKHWAFTPVSRPREPEVRNAAWIRTPIDRFLLARMEQRGVAPNASAAPETWLRRVHLALTGLPPAPDEVRAFLADASEKSRARVIEDLLARPQYGERWARRWLDVVRYAESNGYERDGTKPNVWRYRDWVIDAFYRDKPYDRFVTEQLAGDEMPGASAETLIATTFLRLGSWDDEPAEPLQDRYDQLDDVLGTTSAAFLGVTLRCARCHDHKFEPFTQRDYYRTLAVFTPLRRPQNGRSEFDRHVGTEAELRAYEEDKKRADDAIADLDRQIDAARQGVLRAAARSKSVKGGQIELLQHAETVLAFRVPAERRDARQKKLVEEFEQKLEDLFREHADADSREKVKGWRDRKIAIDKARMKEPPRAYIWYEDTPAPPATHLLTRGDPNKPGDEVEPGAPAILGGPDTAPQPLGRSSGRRLWFARWLTRPDHPLTARVMVNRIWQGHFGEGLAASENDFGVMGQRPENQELLDWLAAEFVASGWSVKHVQRLIVKSAAYALSSDFAGAAAKLDPENKLRWRWTPRRLDAEIVRDSALAVSGALNSKTHGPSVYPKLPEAVLAGQSRPGNGWGKSTPEEASRRSVYIFVKRSLAAPELEALDSPDTTASCEQRSVSTTGPQALIFFNGEFTHEQARLLAVRVAKEAGANARDRVRRAYLLALAREATEAEVSEAMAFLERHEGQITRERGADPATRALEGFALVLLNSNEFFYTM